MSRVKLERVSFFAPTPTLHALKSLSQREGRSMSELFRTALDLLLEVKSTQQRTEHVPHESEEEK